MPAAGGATPTTSACPGPAGPRGRALAPLAVDDHPEVREPADPAAPPIRVAAPPVVINGRIDPPGDEDRFVAGGHPRPEAPHRVAAADLGSALDGVLQVLAPRRRGPRHGRRHDHPAAPKGDDASGPALISPDPSLDFTVPAGKSEMTLALRDLEGRGGVGFPYRITVEPIVPRPSTSR